jgi:hypothetical protein
MTTKQIPATTGGVDRAGVLWHAPRQSHTPDSVTPRDRQIDEDGNPCGPTAIQLNVGVHVHGGGMEFTVTDENTCLDIQDLATPLSLAFEDHALLNLTALTGLATRAMLRTRGRAPDQISHPVT